MSPNDSSGDIIGHITSNKRNTPSELIPPISEVVSHLDGVVGATPTLVDKERLPQLAPAADFVPPALVVTGATPSLIKEQKLKWLFAQKFGLSTAEIAW